MFLLVTTNAAAALPAVTSATARPIASPFMVLPPFVDQDVSVGIERQRLAAVADVGGDLSHGDALADLDADEAVAKIVGRVVGDAGGLAGIAHRVADPLPTGAGEDSP